MPVLLLSSRAPKMPRGSSLNSTWRVSPSRHWPTKQLLMALAFLQLLLPQSCVARPPLGNGLLGNRGQGSGERTGPHKQWPPEVHRPAFMDVDYPRALAPNRPQLRMFIGASKVPYSAHSLLLLSKRICALKSCTSCCLSVVLSLMRTYANWV